MKYTKSDFELFRREALKWIQQLGLSDWHVSFHHRSLGESTGANFQCDLEAKSAAISLNSDEQVPAAYPKTVQELAKHEVLHLLLAPLAEKAEYRFVRQEELHEAEHGIVQKLMKLL